MPPCVMELTHSCETQWEVPALREVVMSCIPYLNLWLWKDVGNHQISGFNIPTTVMLCEQQKVDLL